MTDDPRLAAATGYLRDLLVGIGLSFGPHSVLRDYDVEQVARELLAEVDRAIEPSNGHRLIVTGSRESTAPLFVPGILQLFRADTVLVHGANYDRPNSVDRLAHEYWTGLGRQADPHPAHWSHYRGGAGPIRNEEMAAAGATACLAYPGGTGTANMVERAHAHSIPVLRGEP